MLYTWRRFSIFMRKKNFFIFLSLVDGKVNMPGALVAIPTHGWTTWERFWDNLGTSQVLLGDNLDCLWTNWWLPVDYLVATWDYFGNIWEIF